MSAPSNGCVGHGKGGIEGTYYQQCHIDNSLSIFFIFTAGIALFQIKRMNLLSEYENNNYHGSL